MSAETLICVLGSVPIIFANLDLAGQIELSSKLLALRLHVVQHFTRMDTLMKKKVQPLVDALAVGLVEVNDAAGKGAGLFCVVPLENNTWIGDYTGEVLTQIEFQTRYPNHDANYVLTANIDYHIDGRDSERSGHMRYSNHSSTAPNACFTVIRKRRQRHKEVQLVQTLH